MALYQLLSQQRSVCVLLNCLPFQHCYWKPSDQRSFVAQVKPAPRWSMDANGTDVYEKYNAREPESVTDIVPVRTSETPFAMETTTALTMEPDKASTMEPDKAPKKWSLWNVAGDYFRPETEAERISSSQEEKEEEEKVEESSDKYDSAQQPSQPETSFDEEDHYDSFEENKEEEWEEVSEDSDESVKSNTDKLPVSSSSDEYRDDDYYEDDDYDDYTAGAKPATDEDQQFPISDQLEKPPLAKDAAINGTEKMLIANVDDVADQQLETAVVTVDNVGPKIDSGTQDVPEKLPEEEIAQTTTTEKELVEESTDGREHSKDSQSTDDREHFKDSQSTDDREHSKDSQSTDDDDYSNDNNDYETDRTATIANGSRPPSGLNRLLGRSRHPLLYGIGLPALVLGACSLASLLFLVVAVVGRKTCFRHHMAGPRYAKLRADSDDTYVIAH